MAVTHAFNQSDGKVPSSSDFFLSIANGVDIIRSAIFLRNIGCHISGPGDLPGFNSRSFFRTISSSITKVSNGSPMKMSDACSGMFSRSSFVKTLVKNELSTSAFSDATLASEPSGFFSVGILFLVFVFEFTYDQNCLGDVFILCATFFQN